MESQPGDHRKFVDENLREQFLAGMDLVSAEAKLETSETVNDASVAIGGTYQILLQSKEVKTTHDLNGLFMIFYVMAIQSRNGSGRFWAVLQYKGPAQFWEMFLPSGRQRATDLKCAKARSNTKE